MMESPPENPARRRVGLLYDDRMCRHSTPDGESHPENPERIRAIWRKLEAEGIPERCMIMDAKEAKDEYLASVHTQNHINLIRNISSKAFDSRRPRIASKYNSIYFNKGSSEAAYLAAGSVIEVSERVAKGDLNSAIAIVRPPGHHAEPNEAMGFCLFNNVAIAANFLLTEKAVLGIKKILIVDWDVHHGNGTQNMFYKDPRVLFFSVHRFDFGSFYPAGGDGSHCMIGEGDGAGYNINVPWEHGQCGDADYIAVWDHVLIPVAEAYNPDIILISAGFDAALGDPLGGCCITPYGYSLMLRKMMGFAQGKIVMALEGGYNLNSIANSVLACAKTLLEEKPIIGSIVDKPFESTWRVIREVRDVLKAYWPVLSIELPQKTMINNSQLRPVEINLNSSSDSDVENDESVFETICSVNFAGVVEDVTLPFSKLNVDEDNHGKSMASAHTPVGQSAIVSSEACNNAQALMPDQIVNGCISWRSLLSKTEVWYGSYGSNMWKQRFLCYIEGGKLESPKYETYLWDASYYRKYRKLFKTLILLLKVEGMNRPCHGSMDKSSPKDVIWKAVPHRLFFARSHTQTWGIGGVAFLHPESNIHDKAYMCMYKITLEQFNDVLLQENSTNQHMESPLFRLSDLDFVAENKTMLLEAIKGGWYSNVLYLGEEDNIPILTMTCSLSNIEQFKSGKLPICAPSEDYMNTLVKGLIEGEQLTAAEAIDYINDAAAREL